MTRFLPWCMILLILAEMPAGEVRPNIVCIISDDQAWTDFGFVGNKRVHTPNIDALAARSARFLNGYVPSSVCRPSLVTLLTGLYPHQHGVHFNHGPPGNSGYNRMNSRKEYERVREREFELIGKVDTLPGVLSRELGYRCLQTGKFWEGHWRNGGFTEGMTTFEPPPLSQTFGGVRVLANGERVAHGNGDVGLQIGRVTMEPITGFIDECEKKEVPWMVWYAPYLPHEPHDSPERFFEMARNRPGVEEHELPYFASIAQFDATVGELVKHVEGKGVAGETVFVFLVDNGWSPSETRSRNRPDNFVHTKRSKRAPFDAGIRTPILIRWDGVVKPLSHEGLASSIDLMPTLLSAAGREDMDSLPGVDLLPVARGDVRMDPDRAVFGAIYPGDATSLDNPGRDLAYRWIRKREHKLIVAKGENPWGGYVDGAVLFDLAKDPGEERNLGGMHEFSEIKAGLRRELDSWWRGNGRK